MATLQSKWGSLSKHLLGTLYAVDARGDPIPNQDAVAAPLTDGNIEITANWQSPFEQAGAESKAPAIMAMIQSGAAESYLLPFLGKGDEGSLRARISDEITKFSREGQGRTGLTKLNSTQIFTGAAPLKFPVTMHFRAYDDPAAEVQNPIDQIASWALPQELALRGGLAEAVLAARTQGKGILDALFPSKAPTMVGLLFGGFRLAPMVIESMAYLATGPRTRDGMLTSAALQLSLTTITAMDREDWARARTNKPLRLFNNT